MALTTCDVLCLVTDNAGEPIVGALVSAKLNRFEMYEGFLIPTVVEATTDASGLAVLPLWPNELGATESHYSIRITVAGETKILRIKAVVPNLPSVNLHDISTMPPYPGMTGGELVLASIIETRNTVNAAVDIAQLKADAAALSEANALSAAATAAAQASAAELSAVDALAAKVAAEAVQLSVESSLDAAIALVDTGAVIAAETAAREAAIAQEILDRNAAIALEAQARIAKDAELEGLLNNIHWHNPAEDLEAETAARIAADAQEALDRAAAVYAETQARNAAIAAETAARTTDVNSLAQGIFDTATDLAEETSERTAALAAETLARNVAVAQEVLDRNAAIAVETQARIDDVAVLTDELIDTNASLAVETQARIDAVQAEAAARLAAITSESRTRSQQAQENAEALLRTSIAVDIERIGRGEAIAQAKFDLNTEIVEGLSAEASARLVLQAEVASNAALISSEQLARATADEALAQDITLLVAETDANTAAISSETLARTTADSALSSEISVLGATVAGNTAAISTEQSARVTADDALATQIVTTASGVAANLSAIQNEVIARTNADTALASQITTLTATVGSNTAAITSEQTARTNADTAMAADITTLNADVDDAFAAIEDEATARASAVSAESTARSTLAAQLRGTYTGSDLSAITSGLIYQERIARVNEDSSLAQQITLLSAGAGEQFDWQTIWYFDSGVESWTGNGTPTTTQGWLRPANQASDAYVESPVGVAADGTRYGQVRLRIRKVGVPTFAGFLWWRGTADTTWDAARRIALTEPTYNDDDIGLITVSPSWAIEIDRIRVDLSSAQDATDYFEIDWVAIGRPSPGASSAQLLEEQTARASADAVEITAREALSVKLTGSEDPDALTLGTLTSGLLFDERSARTTEDGVLASSITSLTTTVTTNNTTLSSAITTEQTARIAADSAISTTVSTLTGVVNDNTAAITAEETARANADTAIASNVTALTTRVETAEADIIDEASARTTADTAEVTAREILSTKLLGDVDPDGLTLGTVTSGLIFDERSARVSEDTAIATSVSSLTITVTNNYTTLDAAITSEATARSTADAAEATERESLSTVILGQADPTGLTLSTLAAGLVYEERSARVTEDSALSTSISGLSSSVGTLTADLETLQETVVDLNEATVRDITTLVATDKKQNQQALDQNAEATLWDVLALDAERTLRQETMAVAREELTVKIQDGLLAEATARLTLVGQLDANTAAIIDEQIARATADDAVTTSLSALIAQTGDDALAAVAAETLARTTAIDAEVLARESLAATVNDPVTGLAATIGLIEDESAARVSAIDAEATLREALAAIVNDPVTGLAATSALLVTESETRADEDSALSGLITTAQTTADGAVTSVTTALTSIDGIQGKYSVKVDNNGYVTGFDLISTANDVVPFSEFAVVADKFSLAPVATDPTTDSSAPFFVLTAPQTVGGVTIPAGTYIKSAFIHDASIVNAKIADAAIDNAKIANLDAAKITTGFIDAARIDAESITADKIDTKNLTIKDALGNVIFGASASLDWSRITSQPTGIYNSNISIGSDGTLTGAGGGTVSLTGLGAGAFATVDQLTSANVSTYIASAAIGEAYIGDLSASKITSGFIDAARIDVGSIDAKIATITSAQIDNTIQSTNYDAVAKTGWQINKAGTIVLNQANVRGEVNVGAYTGYAWPASGTGVHLSESGILAGNYNSGGKYFQISTPADGEAAIYTNIPAYIEDLQITGGKLADLTIGSGKIADAAITNAKINDLSADKINAGTLSADRITSGSLDAKIANISAAKITSGSLDMARIGTASISTLKLEGNAVTIPVNASASGVLYGNGGWQDAVSATITAPADILLRVVLFFNARVGYWIPSSVVTGYRILRNGSLFVDFGLLGAYADFPSFQYYTTVTAGATNTYTVQFYGANSDVSIDYRAITLLGVKR